MPATTTTHQLMRAFDEVEALIDDLQPDEWDVQSLCPDWTTRGVVCHIAGIEHVLSDWLPSGVENPPPFDRFGAFLEESRSWSNEELGAETKRILAQRRADLPGLGDDLWDVPTMTPVGPGSYRRFMEFRCFDLWVHVRDLTIPLGRPTDDGGPVAERAVDEVAGSIGYIVGKKIGAPDGSSISFHLTGPVERDIHAVVEGRARAVDELTDPTVTVTADSVAFVMLACGRVDPQRMIDEQRISWTGDQALGDRATRNLAFTM
jgi:uncharacterized protein (TIGR03083 family)